MFSLTMLKFHLCQGKSQPIRLWYWMLIHVWPFTIPCWPAYHVLVFVYPYSWYAIFHSFFAFEPARPGPHLGLFSIKNKVKKNRGNKWKLDRNYIPWITAWAIYWCLPSWCPSRIHHPPNATRKRDILGAHYSYRTITVIRVCTWRK